MDNVRAEYLIDLADRLRALDLEIRKINIITIDTPLRMATAADRLAAEKLLERARQERSL